MPAPTIIFACSFDAGSPLAGWTSAASASIVTGRNVNGATCGDHLQKDFGGLATSLFGSIAFKASSTLGQRIIKLYDNSSPIAGGFGRLDLLGDGRLYADVGWLAQEQSVIPGFAALAGTFYDYTIHVTINQSIVPVTGSTSNVTVQVTLVAYVNNILIGSVTSSAQSQVLNNTDIPAGAVNAILIQPVDGSAVLDDIFLSDLFIGDAKVQSNDTTVTVQTAAPDLTQSPIEVGTQATDVAPILTQSPIEVGVAPLPPLTLACPVDTVATVGVPYTGALIASGGAPPYTYSISAGALPPGLSLDPSTGAITGIPLSSGSYDFTGHVVDSVGNEAEASCSAGIVVSPSGTCAERVGPKIYFWEPSFLDLPEDIAMRATDWDNAGLEGAKFVQGFLLEADTMGEDKVIVLQGDQMDLQTYTINHNGRLIKPYVLDPAKIASLLRLISTDDVPWRYFANRPVWEPLPELVTRYETQGTTHDIPGYQFLKDGYISLISTATVTLVVNVDGVDYTYLIPSTGGAHAKTYLIFGINEVTGRTLKGKEYRYLLTSPAGFRLYQRDCEVRVHAWSFGDYQIKQPFGEVSRIQGAKI